MTNNKTFGGLYKIDYKFIRSPKTDPIIHEFLDDQFFSKKNYVNNEFKHGGEEYYLGDYMFEFHISIYGHFYCSESKYIEYYDNSNSKILKSNLYSRLKIKFIFTLTQRDIQENGISDMDNMYCDENKKVEKLHNQIINTTQDFIEVKKELIQKVKELHEINVIKLLITKKTGIQI
jgi:hypothetical protein